MEKTHSDPRRLRPPGIVFGPFPPNPAGVQATFLYRTAVDSFLLEDGF